MTVRLRPHHLLCLLTYVGKGYSSAFIANYDSVAKRIVEGEAMLIVAGPDDICAPLLGEPDTHCFRESVEHRDRLAARDAGSVLGCTVEIGSHLVLDAASLKALRNVFAVGSIREACLDCPWADLCTSVAEGGYSGVVLPSGDA